MRLSIVTPVLNEEHLIEGFLRHLRAMAPGAEIIVVDGGSHDRTASRARAIADHVITADPGRGRQMNAGASMASGQFLWFLHADSAISREAVVQMEEYMHDQAHAGGCFSLKIVPRRWVYRIRDLIGDRCVDLFGIALGDRGLFCRRSAFISVGGYTAGALFEDANLYRSLRRVGRTRRLKATVKTSSRRYEAQGPVRTCLFYGFVMLLYWIGLRHKTLERLVFRFASRANHGSRASAAQPLLRHPASLQLKPNL